MNQGVDIAISFDFWVADDRSPAAGADNFGNRPGLLSGRLVCRRGTRAGVPIWLRLATDFPRWLVLGICSLACRWCCLVASLLTTELPARLFE